MANSLVVVSNLNGAKNSDVIRSIKTNLATAENSAFKVATKCAWLVGVSIPCGSGTITNPSPLKPKQVYSKVEKSKATLSRWMSAVKYIIENNLFDDFNDGKYAFSFDKIIAIFKNELITDDRTFEDLMSMSITDIEALYKTEDETEEIDGQVEETEENTNIVEFTYNGQVWKVGEKTLIEFISNYCQMA